MKKLLLLIGSCAVFLNSKAQWLPQTSPSSNNFHSVFALNPNAVGIAGVTGCLRSTDGGNTWAQNVTLTGVNVFELHSRNPLRWYALTQNSAWYIRMNNPSGVSLSSGRPDSILSIHYLNLNCAVAVGTAGKIEATCDTGATWQLRSSGVNANLNAVWFATVDTGCAVGASGTIVRTINAGNSWTSVNSGTTTSLNGIHFPTQSVGYIVGNGGKLLKSTDAGASWTNMPTGVLNTLNGVYFVDQDTGYVVGTGGLIMKTLNGGVNWYNMNSGTTNILNSVHFADPISGWVVGSGGTILKYNGSAGLGLIPIQKETEFMVYPNPAHDVIYIEAPHLTGQILITNALGQEIHHQEILNGNTKVDVSQYAKGVYFISLESEMGIQLKKFIKE